jgi:hypothetical protein
VNYSNRPIYRKRRRIALLVIVGFLILVGLLLVGLRAGGTDGGQVEQVDSPTVEQAPEVIDEQTIAEEDEPVEEETKE